MDMDKVKVARAKLFRALVDINIARRSLKDAGNTVKYLVDNDLVWELYKPEGDVVAKSVTMCGLDLDETDRKMGQIADVLSSELASQNSKMEGTLWNTRIGK